MTFPIWFNDLHLPFLEASVECGIPYNPDNVRSSPYSGVVGYHLTLPTGRRKKQWVIHWHILH